jgi:hypothetical protein
VATDNQQAQTRSEPVEIAVLPFRVTPVEQSQNQLMLNWAGGRPPYVIEQRASLAPGTPWETVTITMDANIALPLNGPAVFFRVRSAE